MGFIRRSARLVALAGVAMASVASGLAETASPPRSQGLAPETLLKDAPPLKDASPRNAQKKEPAAHGGRERSQGEKGRDAPERKPAEGETSARPQAAQPETPPLPPPRPEDLGDRRGAGAAKPEPAKADAAASEPAKPAQSGAASSPQPEAVAMSPSAAEICLIELAALGADAIKADAPASENGCGIETPVRLKSVATRDGKIAVHGEPLIACATARAAALYLLQNVAPVAKGATGMNLAGVTAAGFECRPRNRQPGGKLSAHGKGLALDVLSFQFSDGSTTTVASPGERLAFLNGARKAACGYFTTVLGPGADEAHRDHLHLDIEAHGASGYGRICQ